MSRRGTITVDVKTDLDERSIKRVGQEAKALLELIETDLPVGAELNRKEVAAVGAQVERMIEAFHTDFDVNPNIDERAFQRMEREIESLIALLDAEIGVDVELDEASLAAMQRRLSTVIEAFEAANRLNILIDEDELEDTGSRMGKALSRGLNKNVDVGPFNFAMKTVLGAATLLIPLAVELGIAATGIVGAFTVIAGAAGAGAFGIYKLIDSGDEAGKVLVTGFERVKAVFEDLARVTALGLAPGLAESLNTIQNGLRLLENQFSRLAPIIGNTVSNAVTGLFGLLIQLEPVTMMVANALEDMSEKFAKFGTGAGGAAFVDRILQSFKDLGPLVSALGGLFSNVFGAAAGAFGNFAPILTIIVEYMDRVISHARSLIDTFGGGGEILKGFTSIFEAVFDLIDAGLGGLASGAAGFKFLFVGIGKVAQALGFLLKGLNYVLKPIATFIGWIVGGFAAIGKLVTAFKFLFIGLTKIGSLFTVATRGIRGFGAGLTRMGALLEKIPGFTKFAGFIQEIGVRFSQIGANFNRIGAGIRAVFEDIALIVKGAGKAIGDFLTNIPVIGKVFEGAGRVAGKALEIVKAGFKPLSEAAGALGGVINGVFGNDAPEDIKKTKDALEKARGEALLAEGDFQSLSVQLASLNKADRVELINDAMKSLRKELDLTKAKMNEIAATFGLTDKAVEDGALTLNEYTTLIKGVNDQLQNGPPSTVQFIKAIDDFSQSTGTAADKAALFHSFLTQLRGEALNNVGSMLAVKTGIVGVRDAMIELGPNLRAAVTEITNLSKGSGDLGKIWDTELLTQTSALQNALLTQADAANEAARRIFELNVETMGTEGAAKIATRSLNLTYDALVKQATQAGLSTAETEALLTALGLVPPDVSTTMKLFGGDTVEDILTDIRNLFVSVFKQQGYDTDVVIKDKTKGGSAPFLAGLQGQLNKFQGDYIANLRVNKYGTEGIPSSPYNNARGTSNFPGGWSWVGEEGPELMQLPRGTQIKSNPESVRMARGAANNANGTGGTSYGDITVLVSVDDLAKIQQVNDFLDMLGNARVQTRKTERSGTVNA